MSTASSNLALIYSRLADLELQQNAGNDILDLLSQKLSLDQLQESVAQELENRFQTACSQPDTIGSIKEIFAEEHNMKDALMRSLGQKVQDYRAHKLSKDKLIADTLRMREAITSLTTQINEVGELCRKLQVLEKEKIQHHSKMLEVEVEKTQSIEKECGLSLSSVTARIEAEESDIATKAAENNDLTAKLEQFRGHLELRREKQRNEARTKELVSKLEAAKQAQQNYEREQAQLKRDSCRSKLVHSQETVLQLEQQLAMYDNKFADFEETLRRTAEVVAQLDAREQALLQAVAGLRRDNAEWKTKAAQADVALIAALDDKRGAEEKLATLRAAAGKAEQKCRQLQARRQQQQQTAKD